MIKILLKYFFVLLISILASQCLFYYVIDDYMGRIINPSLISNISMRILVAVILFFSTYCIMEKQVNKIQIDILAVFYFIIVIELSFLRGVGHSGTNLNPITIMNDFKTYFRFTLIILLGNLMVYFPLGLYIKYRTKIDFIRLIMIFIVFIGIVEFSQLSFRRGVFDINDIIINTLGFFLGLIGMEFIQKIRQKKTSMNSEYNT